MSPRRARGAVLGLVALGLGLAPLSPVSASPRTRADADLVIVLPALDRATSAREQTQLRHWLRHQGLSYAFVPLWRILGGRDPAALTADDVRQYLRRTFTWRTSTKARPRYLGIFASPTAGYTGVTSTLPAIPRFSVPSRPVPFDSDVPYQFLPPATVDGGDGNIDPRDLDLTAPTFEVFRVPINRPADIAIFVHRHETFGQATRTTPAYGHDVTLAAGMFGLVDGDTSLIHCITARQLEQRHLVDHVLKVFDADVCAPDVRTRAEGPHLADVLADPNGSFHGGTIVDISHGSSREIVGRVTFDGAFFPNLTVADVARIPKHRLNVFISIACDNDGPGAQPNLAAAMYQRASVAVISATTTVTPVSAADILAAEVDSIVGLYEHHENLLQRLQAFRADYYRRFVLTASPPVRRLLWINLLTVNLVGDGFITVAH